MTIERHTPYDNEQQMLEESNYLSSSQSARLVQLRARRIGYIQALVDFTPLVAACRALIKSSTSRGFCNDCQMSLVTGQYAYPEELEGSVPRLAHTNTCIVQQAQTILAALGEGEQQEWPPPDATRLFTIHREPQAISDPLPLLDGTVIQHKDSPWTQNAAEKEIP